MSIVLSMIKQLIATRIKKNDAETVLQALRDLFAGGSDRPIDPTDLETVLAALPAFRRLAQARMVPLSAPSGQADGVPTPGLLIDLDGECARPEIREVLDRHGQWRVVRRK